MKGNTVPKSLKPHVQKTRLTDEEREALDAAHEKGKDSGLCPSREDIMRRGLRLYCQEEGICIPGKKRS